MEVYLNGKKIRLDARQAIGKGGEADVFAWGKSQAIKLFKQPNHPDYQQLPQEQQAAQRRLAEHQQKLRQFPVGLPAQVVQPEALVTDRQGQTILGYVMPLVAGAEVLMRYGDRSFRKQGISQAIVLEIFRDLHTTLSKLHFAGVVIGDFNDLNVLVRDRRAYLIDADSFQYGNFFCKVFTSKFVDPLLCDPQATRPLLQQPFGVNSDWYAFTVMLMQCLLLVDPYGGVYRPKDPAQQVPHDARSLKRISIFHPEVRYPKPAFPYSWLPDELLHYFQQVLHQDLRGKFPRSLLELQWIQCPVCGIEHGRACCPECLKANLISVKPAVMVRGTVTATPIFCTEGQILAAALEGNTLHWLEYDRETYRREDGAVVLSGGLQSGWQFWLQGSKTLVGQAGQVVILQGDRVLERLAVDPVQTRSAVAVNSTTCYWSHNGQLLRQGFLGAESVAEYIGDVLSGQTQFWVGSDFGFGFYRASNLTVGFVFDTQRAGINDRVPFPSFAGQLIDATCVFSPDYAWCFLAIQEQGQTLNRCVVICSDGSLVGQAQAIQGDGSWLGQWGGHCAAAHFLLAATDEGIVRIQPNNGQLIKVKEFPDTEPFVNAASQLFLTPQGLYVVNQREIHRLKLS